MSQMTVSQMSITETTPSPQHKLHWLAEQALNWSGLLVVHVRPTVFLEGFFLQLSAPTIKRSNVISLPMGDGKTSPISVYDVARAVPRFSRISRRTLATSTTSPGVARRRRPSTRANFRSTRADHQLLRHRPRDMA
jgi:uncharacterized protein YbjT (DUF2867 family)